jgi:hypothetical protein
MTAKPILIPFIVCVGLTCSRGEDRPSVEEQPKSAAAWIARDDGMLEWGSGGGCIYGTSGKPKVLDVWQWAGNRMVKVHEVPVEDTSGPVVPMRDDHFLMGKAESDMLFIRSSAGAANGQWTYGKHWYLEQIRPSSNGNYVVVALLEESTNPLPDYDFHRDRVQLALLDVKREQLDWIATVRRKDNDGETLRQIAVSDDGRLIAIAAWGNGVAVVSVAEKRLLWELRPKGEVGTTDAVFSPDGKVLYSGGAAGCVYVMDSSTGEIRNKWWATDDDKSVYGQRISCLSVSGDGRYVAAGTGPEGLVYLATSDGKKVRTYRHRGPLLTICVSPDSKYLATAGTGSIKIWDLPRSPE